MNDIHQQLQYIASRNLLPQLIYAINNNKIFSSAYRVSDIFEWLDDDDVDWYRIDSDINDACECSKSFTLQQLLDTIDKHYSIDDFPEYYI